MQKRLNDVQVGKVVEIIDFTDKTANFESSRFGLYLGQRIKCKAKIGPIIVSKNFQTIAIGKTLSEKIIVKDTF